MRFSAKFPAKKQNLPFVYTHPLEQPMQLPLNF